MYCSEIRNVLKMIIMRNTFFINRNLVVDFDTSTELSQRQRLFVLFLMFDNWKTSEESRNYSISACGGGALFLPQRHHGWKHIISFSNNKHFPNVSYEEDIKEISRL